MTTSRRIQCGVRVTTIPIFYIDLDGSVYDEIPTQDEFGGITSTNNNNNNKYDVEESRLRLANVLRNRKQQQQQQQLQQTTAAAAAVAEVAEVAESSMTATTRAAVSRKKMSTTTTSKHTNLPSGATSSNDDGTTIVVESVHQSDNENEIEEDELEIRRHYQDGSCNKDRSSKDDDDGGENDINTDAQEWDDIDGDFDADDDDDDASDFDDDDDNESGNSDVDSNTRLMTQQQQYEYQSTVATTGTVGANERPYQNPVAGGIGRNRMMTIESQHQRRRWATSLIERDQEVKRNQLLARTAIRNGHRPTNRGNSTKALPSQFVYQPSPADNAAARAIVHHTGSHYHMAGSKQYQRGVRVKGVISRHSQQGAKLQNARMAQKNMYEAREDARGERTAGSGKNKMKQKSSKQTMKNGGGNDE